MRTILLLISIHCALHGYSQSTQVVDKLADAIAVDDADLNYEDLYENLSQLTANPFNINTATPETLLALNILSPAKVNGIIEYIEDNGELLELYELQAIPALAPEDVQALIPFVTVGHSAPARSFIHRIMDQQQSYFFTRYERTLQTAKGFKSTTDSGPAYSGDPGRFYSRFKLTSPKDLSIGFTAEKDAGEQFRWSSAQKGFDFYCGHVQLMNKGPVTNFIAGDFTAQFGQGLTLGGGYGMGKGSETITTLRRNSTGFMPYTSANESGFFRGAAMSVRLPLQLLAHTFYSSLSRDASGVGSENDTAGSLSVLQSGKHRTISEFATRHTTKESNLGFALELKRQVFDAGVVVHATSFQHPIEKSPTIYNTFDFRGDQNINAGVFGTYTVSNFSLFAEAAKSLQHGHAWLGGILGSVSRTIDVSLLLRSFNRDYYTFYSNAISENTTPKNEQGIYWGLKHAISKKLSFTTYTDLFRFPWIRFRNYMPSTGSEILIRVTYRFSKSIDFYAQYRDERKTRNAESESQEYQVKPTRRQNLILNCSMVNGNLWVKTRVQYSRWHQSSVTSGFAIALDAGFDWNKLSFSGRVALFDTDDFDNRHYMNERDVLMSFSFPAYNGEGTRSYLVLRWQPASWLDLWAKLGATTLFNAESLGSGNDTIEGNKRHDVKAELVFRF
jgi:Helix-hairpin-helix motif